MKKKIKKREETGREKSSKKSVKREEKADKPKPSSPPSPPVDTLLYKKVKELANAKMAPMYAITVCNAVEAMEKENVLETVGETVLQEFMALLKDDKRDEAREHYIRHMAGPDELIAGMEESADRIRKGSSALEDSADKVLSFVTKAAASLISSLLEDLLKK